VLALLVAVLVSRRITRPVVRLIESASLHEEAVRLGRMVEDLQTLAAAAAALQLNRRPCDVAQPAAVAAEDWESSFTAAGSASPASSNPAPVLAEPGRLASTVMARDEPGRPSGPQWPASLDRARRPDTSCPPGPSPPGLHRPHTRAPRRRLIKGEAA
jgi:hypothetical protein